MKEERTVFRVYYGYDENDGEYGPRAETATTSEEDCMIVDLAYIDFMRSRYGSNKSTLLLRIELLRIMTEGTLESDNIRLNA